VRAHDSTFRYAVFLTKVRRAMTYAVNRVFEPSLLRSFRKARIDSRQLVKLISNAPNVLITYLDIFTEKYSTDARACCPLLI